MFYFRATATAPLFFALALPRRAPPFSVCASGVVALKVAQVPSIGFSVLIIIYQYWVFLIVQEVAFNLDFPAKFVSEMAQKCNVSK